MRKHKLHTFLSGAFLAFSANLVGAQAQSTTTPPQAYPKGQAVGAEGEPITLDECRAHMALAQDSRRSNDPQMRRKGEQCAQLMAIDAPPATTMPGQRSSATTPPQVYPKGQAKGAEDNSAGLSRSTSDSTMTEGKSDTVTPPQAYPKGQAQGAEGTSAKQK